MQILFADPRDRRGTLANRAMLSTLRGLAGEDGATLSKKIADDKAAIAAATAAVTAATAKTSRDSQGIPSWSVGGPNILFTDLPDDFTSGDAVGLDGEKYLKAFYGIVHSRDVRGYMNIINVASSNVNDRFAAWVWSRLFSRPGMSDPNLINSLGRTLYDESNQPTYFANSLRWWTGQAATLPDSQELLVDRMVSPEKFRALQEPVGHWYKSDELGWPWGSVLGVIAGAAFVWVKRYAAKGREDNILKAKSDLVAAQSALEADQKAAIAAGLTIDGTKPGETPSACFPGYKVNKDTGKCELVVEQSALPWILGGAAIVGLLLFTRRR